MSAAPINVTTVLQSIWDSVGEPLVVAEVGVALAAIPPPVGPFLAGAWAWVLKVPVLGPWIQGKIKSVVDGLIAKGVIEIKVDIINNLSSEAQAKWSKEIEILKQVKAAGRTLTPAELAAYDAALEKVGQNHPGVVNA